ncbi:hypothetical protein HanXRQr2_Chr04g0189051 [Helianthus annuus]|uniref:Uncharacterized protein n=1 Tax=Helianthus annuus TaxID=4232 RepID=A0A251V2E5_HELAN|nr:uncharacterized protein LOC110938056 [Helianthus annuus]KAF5812121.1 hypothetical protein HanXRQr2_Chr04g0189051 [Helianthus annuus]KAJ0598697.1 hypothetical protein HanHA89_Chr04g0168591 [Helianthus annuus]KAJ0762951.1 hypothetical protein HanOQP8_Chr04g0166881 [Helianthus annuus]
MSVAFETTSNPSDTNRIQLPDFEFSHGMWIYNLPESSRLAAGNPWSSSLPAVKEEEDSAASSSIGNNSDDDSGDGEVQSNGNGDGLLNGFNDLEKVLPIKRGISTFYAGKSKSYGSLADAVSVPTIQDIVKPEDAYSRKRKNMLAHQALFDKGGESDGVAKKLARNGHESADQSALGSMAGRALPPLPCNNRKSSTNELSSSPRMYMSSPWRSLSLSDLQDAGNKGNEVDEH